MLSSLSLSDLCAPCVTQNIKPARHGGENLDAAWPVKLLQGSGRWEHPAGTKQRGDPSYLADSSDSNYSQKYDFEVFLSRGVPVLLHQIGDVTYTQG